MTASERAAVRELIAKHEGYKKHPYRCSAGKLTIGCGRNLDDVGLDAEEARFLLDRDITRCLDHLAQFAWFEGLDRVRQRALIDMRFQLGREGFQGFVKTLAALESRNYEQAAAHMLDSKWARQDTPARARDIADMIRSGREG